MNARLKKIVPKAQKSTKKAFEKAAFVENSVGSVEKNGFPWGVEKFGRVERGPKKSLFRIGILDKRSFAGIPKYVFRRLLKAVKERK